ncbi:MAG: DUF4124 domain-containing protein [Pseudomonadota bacterium]
MYRVKSCFPRRDWVVALVAWLAILVSLPGHARLYKWVDANGNTIYSQTPPPSQANSGHAELNSRGLKLREVDRPLTSQERAELERLERLEAEAAAVRESEAREDRNLIEAFPSLSALDQARDFRLSTLDQKIRYLNSRRSDASDRLAVNADRISNFRRKKLDIPRQLVIEKINLDRDIQKLGERVADMEIERAVVASEFAADRARYLRILADRRLNSRDE